MENFRLTEDFFKPIDTHRVAKELLGMVLVRKHSSGRYQAGMIVEVESYHGFEDKASHASKSRTPRNEVMFGEGGHYYVYFIYGMYWNLNVVSGDKDFPSAILIRALEPIYDTEIELDTLSLKEKFKLASGPGKLCRWMDIDRNFYGKSVENDELFLIDPNSLDKASCYPCEICEKLSNFRLSEKEKKGRTVATKRIGVIYAGESALLEWRYFLKDNPFVSKA